MANQFRIETGKESMITSRTINSKLWFVNNPGFTNSILGYLAKYCQLFEVELYSFIIMGNHFHMIASFPKKNRAQFTKHFNARVSSLLKRHQPRYDGGKIWARPYAEQAIPRDLDLEAEFFYCALNPVSSGLLEEVTDYENYNSFHDAAACRSREYTVIDWAKYNSDRRYNKKIDIENYKTTYKLQLKRLPGYESLSSKAYGKVMRRKLRTKQIELVKKLRRSGIKFATKEKLKFIVPGTVPFQSKTSNRFSFRPLVLTGCLKVKLNYLEFYFGIRNAYLKCIEALTLGTKVSFPQGTYPPPSCAFI